MNGPCGNCVADSSLARARQRLYTAVPVAAAAGCDRSAAP
ncbi:hypothetical protein C4K19_4293 [Pseudomonas chlororaphis subsp. aurantiaca]|nr:hypothetical protein C4K19_4293 [Pseudomonas chlororaphis subsp. aurantiaca]AZD62079.1 hypothetical protein C4K18_4120 [Pseudomonas chlororaphis subsp. aurantiaca]